MTSPTPPQGPHFSDLGLTPKMLEVLTKHRFTVPTPIQRQAIPVAAQGKDVIGIAQTGTGKTLAFTVPLLQQMAKTGKRGLIILPTRELAGQVDELLRKLGQSFGLRTALLIGGSSMGAQIQALRGRPHVLVGTPGRLNDHLDSRTLQVGDVGILILDEADRMLDMGFAPQIARILKHLPKERQTMLFSATMPAEIVKLASSHMKTPVRIEVARPGTVAEKVNQELFIVRNDQKRPLLHTLLNEYKGTVLIFSRTKYGAKKLCRTLKDMGHEAAEIHSNLSLSQRRRALAGFKSGQYRVLVATDIAARGIDVTNIELVVNYDLPDNLDDYVHRVGRTGRAGKVGQAISFVMPDQRGKIRIIERLVQASLKVSPLPVLPNLPAETPQRYEEERRPYGYHAHGRSSRSRSRFSNRSSSRSSRGEGSHERSASGHTSHSGQHKRKPFGQSRRNSGRARLHI